MAAGAGPKGFSLRESRTGPVGFESPPGAPIDVAPAPDVQASPATAAPLYFNHCRLFKTLVDPIKMTLPYQPSGSSLETRGSAQGAPRLGRLYCREPPPNLWIMTPESPLPLPLPPAPPHAIKRLGAEALDLLTAYGQTLASDGVIRGLIGPREVPILWDRHLLNCAAMAEAVERKAKIVDIGTGAGLPGLVLALVRPDVQVVLIDTLQRRCDFLSEVVEQFHLQDRVTVIWGRAEEVPRQEADIVTARAVAALKKLAPWCMPHARIGGRMLAMKGQKAAEELQAAHKVLHKWSAAKNAEILTCGKGWIDPPVTLVSATRRK